MPKLIFAFIFTVLLVSCSDDDTNVAEKPFFNFINLPEIVIDTVTNANDVWEYGFRFKPLKDGVIEQLGILVPSLGSYEVKLYDIAKGTVLARATLTPTNLHEATFKGINPVQIKAGDDLGLAIVADVFFKVKNLNGESFNFPQTVNNLNIVSFNEEICGSGGCNVFPSTTNFQTIAPCVNLVFKAD